MSKKLSLLNAKVITSKKNKSIVVFSSLLAFSLSKIIAADVSGSVFQDFDLDGVQDTNETSFRDVTGLQVIAYDDANTTVATVPVMSDGTYAITGIDLPVRLELAGLATSFFQFGGVGTNANSNVLFINADTTEADFAVIDPNDFCQTNPLVITPCYVNGDQSGSNDVLVGWNYDGSGTEQFIALANQIGSTWGLAYQRETENLYASAVAKRHSGTGSLGLGGIYVINDPESTTRTIGDFVDLEEAPFNINFGSLGDNIARGLPSVVTDFNNDPDAFGAVGTQGIGDIDLSDDENTLWVTNLNNRSFITLDITDGNVPTAATEITLDSLTGLPASTGGVLRPWALKVRNDRVYVGVTATAETSNNVNDLIGYVISFDANNPTGSDVDIELTIPFNEPHGEANNAAFGTIDAVWYPWRNTFVQSDWAASYAPNGPFNFAFISRPTPVLVDIEFDEDGAMIVGVMDRGGMQMGSANGTPQDVVGSDGVTRQGIVIYQMAGDLLRACLDSSGDFVLESAGVCDGETGASTNNAEGPGGGEFYNDNQDFLFNNTTNHEELSMGALAQLKGSNEIVWTGFDPDRLDSGGIMWNQNTNGSRVRDVELYFGLTAFSDGIGPANGQSGKAVGLGDVELICDETPIIVGNRVWEDTNLNGVQDPSEPGIAGVPVTLSDGSNTVIVTTLADDPATPWDETGTFAFSNASGANAENVLLPNTAYTVSVDINAPELINYEAVTTGASATNDEHDNDANTAGVISYTTGDAGSIDYSLDIGLDPAPCSIVIDNVIASDYNVGADTQDLSVTVTYIIAPDNNGGGAPSVTINGQEFFLSAAVGDSGTETFILNDASATDTVTAEFTGSSDTNKQDTYDQCQLTIVSSAASNIRASGSNVVYDLEVVVGYIAPPATGGITLSIAGQSVTLVNDNSGLQTLTFTGVVVDEDAPQVVTASFENEPTCADAGFYQFPDSDSCAAGNAGGTVFRDFNESGTQDSGEPGSSQVVVRAYDCDNNLVGFGVSDDNGGFVIKDLNQTSVLNTADFTGGLRLEYNVDDNLPLKPGVQGGTLVQFTSQAANTCQMDLAVNNPSEFCSDNPRVVTNCYVAGAVSGGGLNDVLVEWDYTASGKSSSGAGTKEILATKDQIGSTWGLAYSRSTMDIYSATFLKRHVGIPDADMDGNADLGVIYSTNVNNGSTNSWLNLEALGVNVGQIGNDAARGLGEPNVPNSDADAFTKIGRVGLGDMDISDDDSTIYVVNLFENTLIEIDVATQTVIAEHSIPDPGCVGGEFHPFAVKVSNGAVYIGSVCDAINSQNAADLRAYVQRFDGTAFSVVLDFPLNYPKGIAGNSAAPVQSVWNPWTDDYSQITQIPFSGPDRRVSYPQPIFSDIEFDVDGSMILGFLDRTAMIGGFLTDNLIDDGATNERITVGGGDILRAHFDGTQFTLENDGVAGPVTGNTTNNQGPGGGEFYSGEEFIAGGATHEETSLGGLALLPGSGEVAVTVFDPIEDGVASFESGGVRYLSNTNGRDTRAYQVFANALVDGSGAEGVFGKGAGLGDLELICDLAPVEIGNYVFIDEDADGVQDSCDTPLAGINVALYSSADGTTPIATAVTDANGFYSFSSDPNGTDTSSAIYNLADLQPNTAGGADKTFYIVVGTGGQFDGTTLTANSIVFDPTTANVSMTGTNSVADQVDSDGVVSSPIAGLSNVLNTPVTVSAGSFGCNDHSYDFGFSPRGAIGSHVWIDSINRTGTFDTGEGISGVEVELYLASQQPGVDMPVDTTTTGTDGFYFFNGLLPNDYVVYIPGSEFLNGEPLFDVLSLGGAGLDNGTDNDDNGLDTLVNGGVASPTINLTLGSEPINEPSNAVMSIGVDASTDLTVDFGFSQTVSIGNLVWNDIDNDGVNDPGENGIDGVTVQLLLDVDMNGIIEGSEFTPIATTTTTNGGEYSFTGLASGGYAILIPDSNFDPSGGLENFPLSSQVDDPLDNDQNDDDNGIQTGGVGTQVVSSVVQLNAGAESTSDGDSDNTTNLTVDFGFLEVPADAVNLGNLVWFDRNNDGIYQPDGQNGIPGDSDDETGVENVVLELLQSEGTTFTADQLANPVRLTTTDANGNYNFDVLRSDDNYRVRVAASNFASGGALEQLTLSSVPTVTANNNDTDNDDNGTQANAGEETITNGFWTVTTGNEPDVAVDGDGTNGNLTVDFGFTRPVSIGSLVWNDLNNDGERDTGEPGIGGVTVQLLGPSGTAILDTTTTAPDGSYIFDGLPPGDYRIQIPTTGNTGAGQPLNTINLSSSPTDTADNGEDNDDNGIQNAAGQVTISPVINLTVGAESTSDGDTDPDTDLTVDFGFVNPNGLVSLGSYVWEDKNNNAVVDSGEMGLADVVLELYWDEDGDGEFISAGENTALRTTTSSSTGLYFFGNLFPGNYQVRIPDSNFPAGNPLQNHTVSSNDALSDANDNGEDIDDNGFQPGGRETEVSSPVINLAVGAEPTATAGTFPAENGAGANQDGANNSASDANGDMTVDFGFLPLVNLGDLVWYDADNDGIIDAGEPGLPGITVEILFDENNDGVIDGAELTAIDSQVTDGNGNYNFAGLLPGNYQVRIPSSNFGTGNPLEGVPQSSSIDDPIDNNQNNDDNGIQSMGVGTETVSGIVALAADAEVTNDGDGNDGNLTVDFGFTQVPAGTVNIGNLIWFDVNNDGFYDPDGLNDISGDSDDETGIENVTVWLLQSPDATFSGGELTNPVRITTTDANGNYNFDELPSGQNYRVVIPSSNFDAGGALENTPLSSTTTVTGNNTVTDNDDNGSQPTAGQEATSPTYNLTLNTEPFDDGDSTDGNLTVDFGFTRTVSVGNLVWNDLNNDGERDAGEPGVEGVAVTLLWDFNDSGTFTNTVTPLGGTEINFMTTTTDANGNYIFDGLAPGRYRVDIGTVNFGASQPLNDLNVSSSITDTADNQENDDDNGTQVSPSAVVISPEIILTLDGEPTGDGDTSADSDLTIDFGFFDPDSMVSIGSFVWEDRNNDGLVTGGEPGIANVLVELYWDEDGDGVFTSAGEDAALRTTTTNGSGQYFFGNLFPGNYQVRIPTSNFAIGEALETRENSSNDLLSDTNDNGEDNDDNGLQPGGAGTEVSSPLITLSVGDEPQFSIGTPVEQGSGENQDGRNTPADASGDMTVDFGFVPYMNLGDLVWNDVNNDGVFQSASEAGIDGVLVELLFDADGNGVIEGIETTPIASQTTSGGGLYNFTNILPGTYQVQIPASNFSGGALDTTPISSDDDDTADNRQNNDDNGLQPDGPGTVTVSPLITIVANGEITTDGDGANGELTIDFGFNDTLNPVSIGSYVWEDRNNDGLVTSGEPGIANVTLELYRDLDRNGDFLGAGEDVPVSTTTTNASGFYIFGGLEPGDYQVRIPVSNFDPSAALETRQDSSNDALSDANDNGEDNDDNGFQPGGQGTVISSPIIDLGVGEEPQFSIGTPVEQGPGENQDGRNTIADRNGDMTIDFGVVPFVNLGDLVWNDVNNNGVFNAGSETGIDNVTVELLFDADNNGVIEGTELTAIASQTTSGGGLYNFTQLVPGNYQVRIPDSNFAAMQPLENLPYSSAVDDSADNNQNNDDNGLQPDGAGAETLSPLITLLPATEITTDGDGNNGNLTVDFGFTDQANLVSIGSYVWEDRNNDGLVTGGEPGIANVTIEVYQDIDGDGLFTSPGEDVAVDTTMTNVSGFYFFNTLEPGDYQVRIPDTNFVMGNALETRPFSSNDVISDDQDNGEDNDDNGFQPGGQATVISSPIINLAIGQEPQFSIGTPVEQGAGENQDGRNTAADADGDMTVDFGVTPLVNIGNLVWNDVNDDGIFQTATESGIDGVVVELLFDADNNGVIDGTELTTVIDTQTTAGGGAYDFTDLPPGNYQIRIPQSNFDPMGALENIATSSTSDDVNDNNQNNDDNGIQPGGSGSETVSPVINVTAFAETTADGDGNSGNLTIDFGFTDTPTNVVNIGNLVWFDRDNDGMYEPDGEDMIPGNADDETVIENVVLELIQGGVNGGAPNATQLANPIRTTTTASNGLYGFDNLQNNLGYRVRVAASNFEMGGALENFPLSSSVTDNADNNQDNDDNGAQTNPGEETLSPTVRLLATTEPDTPVDGDGTSGNLTVDFGFTQTMSLGSLVWNDINNDGERDGGEPGIDGVTVQLLNEAQNVIIDTVMTDVDGNYLFENIPPGNYVVRIPTTGNTGGGQPLADFTLSSGPTDTADNGEDNDDNGIQASANTNTVSPVISLIPGAEPTDDGDTDPNTDLSVDFGFLSPDGLGSLGSFVFQDRNNDAVFNAGDLAVTGVDLELYWDEDGDGFFTSPGEDVPLRTITTTGTTGINDGYIFNNLVPGNYQIRIPVSNFQGGEALENFTLSSNDAIDSDADDGVDNDDNGTQAGGAGTEIVSPLITLTLGQEPTFSAGTFPAENGPGENRDGRNTVADQNGDMTIDFGVIPLVNIGDLVWNDANNNGAFAGETGIDGVTVELLYDADNNGVIEGAELTAVDSQVTSGGGLYNFTDQVPGNYQVRIPVSNFDPMGPLENLPYSSAVDDTADNRQNNDDNGIQPDGPATETISPLINVAAGAEITTDGDGSNGELTIDFGFTDIPNGVSLGSFIWEDRNNNALVDAGEPALANVVVELYRDINRDGDFDEMGEDVAVAMDTTDASGQYFFDGLEPGDYQVRIPVSNFDPMGALVNHTSSSNDFLSDGMDNGEDSDDNGFQTGGAGTVVVSPIIDLGIAEEPTFSAGNFPAENGVGENQDGRNTAADRNGDMTVDFGFLPFVNLGNLVWLDRNNDGISDPNGADNILGNLDDESGIPNVTVELLFDEDGNGVIDGAETTPIQTLMTGSDGTYNFEDLIPGNYVVQIPDSNFTGGQPLVDNNYSSNNDDPNDNNQDNDDNGLQLGGAGTVTVSPVVTLSGAGEPTNDGDGNNGNLTVDFGFTMPPSGTVNLGNLVWYDRDDDGIYEPDGANGIPGDADDEPGLPNVKLQLIQSTNTTFDANELANPVRETTTDMNGNYLFDDLRANNYYRVVIPDDQFEPGGPLEFFSTSSSVTVTTNNNDTDNDDNGSQSAAREETITQGFWLLTTTGEPQVELDGNGIAGNLTVDFGFITITTIAGNVSQDTDGDGIGDTNIPNITLGLFNDVNGDGFYDPMIDTPVDDPNMPGNNFEVITDSLGNYIFTNVPPGDYLILQTQPSGLTSVTDEDANQAGETNQDDPTNNNPLDNVIPVTVVEGENDDQNNFVEAVPVGVGNLVFEDFGGDGRFDNGVDTPIQGVTVELYRDNGDTIFNKTDDMLVGTDETGTEGDYLILAPVNVETGYFVHITPDNFGAGNAIGFLSSSPGAGSDSQTDDGADENGINSTDPATNGITSTLITLVPGTELTNEVSANPNLTNQNPNGTPDGNIDATIDFAFTSAKPTTFADFLVDNAETFNLDDNSPVGVPATSGGTDTNGDDLDTSFTGNVDGDVYNNLLEFALCFDPGTGMKVFPNGSRNEGFHLEQDNSGASPTLNAKYTQPTGIQDVSYDLQTSTDGQTWTSLVLTPNSTDNGDGTTSVCYNDVLTTIGATGLLRLQITATGTGSTVTDTGVTTPIGWNTAIVQNICLTYADPYLLPCLFTGSVDSAVGEVITVTNSAGTGDLTTLIDPTSNEYYVEVVSGDNVGHRFDIVSVTATMITVEVDNDLCTGAPHNTATALPVADLAGDQIVIREHRTLSGMFPESAFNAGTSIADSAQLLFFDRVNGMYEYVELNENGGSPQWQATTGGADQTNRIIPPSEGLFTHNVGAIADVSILQFGEVRTNSSIVPLKENYNLIGSIYPIAQSPDGVDGMGDPLPNSRQMNTGTGSTGSGARSRADQIQVWRDDFDGDSTQHLCYDAYFYAVSGAIDQWSLTDDSTLADNSGALLFPPDRSALHCIYPDPNTPESEDRLDNSIPSPISNTPNP